MYEKHAELYGALTPQEATVVWSRLRDAGLVTAPLPDEVCGEELALRCQDLSHVDVVLSMSRETDPVAMDALEKLLARPIYLAARGETGVPDADIEGQPLRARVGHRRGEPPRMDMGQAVRRRSPSKPQKRDPRIIHYVQENPKRPGSEAHKRYQIYRVGLALEAAIALGVTRADLRWDLQQGFIRVCFPAQYEEVMREQQRARTEGEWG